MVDAADPEILAVKVTAALKSAMSKLMEITRAERVSLFIKRLKYNMRLRMYLTVFLQYNRPVAGGVQ